MQYRRKISAGRIKVPKYSEEVFCIGFILSICFLFLFAFICNAKHMFLWLHQSGESEETQSEEYDFEDIVADFGKLLFLASVSS